MKNIKELIKLLKYRKEKNIKKISWIYILPRTYWKQEKKEVLTPRQIFNANNGDPMDV